MKNYEKLNVEGFVFDFESFIPNEKNPFPNNRIEDFLVTGPFVLFTQGAFETEHMYERDKILYEDYLLSSGGEKNITPVLGEKVKNDYYGKEFYTWECGYKKWNSIRFDKDDEACDEALYATPQRNAVYYLGVYIDCKQDYKAVICYENSGSSLFLNGEMIDFQPYGTVKGLWGLGYQCLARFKKGRNLLLFKLRPGYIADTLDISLSNCSVFPVIAEDDGIYLSSPSVTLAYSGKADNPLQLFPAFVYSEKDKDKVILSYLGREETLENMKKGEIRPVRLRIDADGSVKCCDITLGNETKKFYFPTTEYDGFKGTERVFSDFHFDTTYHQEQRTYALGAFHITKSIVERLISNPDFKATLSEIDYLHPYYSLYPHHREEIKKDFKTGRAEADCFYNQPNDLTSSGEAFVRNLVYGQLYHRDVLGRISSAYVPGDVFGHFSQMSQVCKKGGCNYIRWGKMMLGMDSLSHHMSPDGTTLIHDKCIGRKDAGRFNIPVCDASSDALDYIYSIPREGDTTWMKDTLNNLTFSVFSETGNDVNDAVKKGEAVNIDVTSRDLTQHHSGVLLTRTDFKEANRLCENLLSVAEKFAAVAFMYGAKYPEKALDKAWRQLLCAMHHDSVTGTNNEISFVDLMIEYRECAVLAADICEKAARFISSGVKTDKREECIFVFNSLPHKRKGVCEFTLPENFKGKYAVLTDTKGKEYPVFIKGNKGEFYSGNIPAMGYAMYRISEKETDTVLFDNDNTIENSRYRITVDGNRGGGIVSLYDKKLKREMADPSLHPLNTVNVLHEIHDRMETQHEIYTDGKKQFSDEYSAEVKSEKCGTFQKLTVRTKLDMTACVIQEITLYHGSDKIDFKTVIEDYNSEDDLFSVTFPMNINGSSVIFDDRFAPHVSTRSKKYMSFQTHQYASFSGCRILPANRWFGIGPTVTVELNKRSGFNIGMTAVIRPNDLTLCGEKLLTALTKKGIPVTPFPDTEQHGGTKIIRFDEDIYSTDTRFILSTEKEKNEYTEKMIANLSRKNRERADSKIGKKGYAIIFRTNSDNEYKKAVDEVFIIAKNKDELTKVIEETEKILSTEEKISFTDVILLSEKSVPDNFGAVIINNGTISSSVEGKSTLNMMLFHTASFYGNMGKVTGGKEMVPEKKTHIFTYQLYIHGGSFREGSVYGKADEFNEKLFAVSDTADGENMFLPEEKGFLSVDGGFNLTAFKAGGYPLAKLQNVDGDFSSRGLVIRGFESSSKEENIKIKTGFEIECAEKCDLLEENCEALKSSKNRIDLTVNSHSIETVKLKAKCREKIGDAIIGAEKEDAEPTFIRSWEHDMGSVPMGYLSLAVTLDRKIEKISDTEIIIPVNIVNNMTDSENSVSIRLESDNGISIDKKEIKSVLKAEESEVIPLRVTLENPDIKGQIRLFFENDGQKFFDIFEFGCFEPEVKLKIEENKIRCICTNKTNKVLMGSLHLAVPFELWGDEVQNDVSFGKVCHRPRSVVLKPNETKEFIFDYSLSDTDYFKAFWASAKLCVNGRIYFGFDEIHGPRHNVWAHEFWKEIVSDNGSIKKILNM